MAQSGGRGGERSEELVMMVNDEEITIEVESEIVSMFDAIQQETNQNQNLEQVLINFLRQYVPKIEQEFETAIFNDYQQVKLQQKVSQNGVVDVADEQDEGPPAQNLQDAGRRQ